MRKTIAQGILGAGWPLQSLLVDWFTSVDGWVKFANLVGGLIVIYYTVRSMRAKERSQAARDHEQAELFKVNRAAVEAEVAANEAEKRAWERWNLKTDAASSVPAPTPVLIPPTASTSLPPLPPTV